MRFEIELPDALVVGVATTAARSLLTLDAYHDTSGEGLVIIRQQVLDALRRMDIAGMVAESIREQAQSVVRETVAEELRKAVEAEYRRQTKRAAKKGPLELEG